VPGKSPMDAQSQRAELLLNAADHGSGLAHAVLSGSVHIESAGPQAVEATAGRLTLNFAGKNILTTARAQEDVRLVQHGANPQSAVGGHTATRQDVEVRAPIIDFVTNRGRGLRTAVTSGAAQIA